jgi:hypothetical protein
MSKPTSLYRDVRSRLIPLVIPAKPSAHIATETGVPHLAFEIWDFTSLRHRLWAEKTCVSGRRKRTHPRAPKARPPGRPVPTGGS